MNIFLSGATGGIGSKIKENFETNGHTVFSPRRLELDMADLKSVQKFLESFNNKIDILINNAGVSEPHEFINLNIEDFQRLTNNNFTSHLLITQHFLKNFVNNSSGTILNIGSIRISELKQGRFEYSLNKSSLHMMTKYIVKEYSKYNIICNTLSPGYVNTNMLYKNNSEPKLKNMLEEIPLKRFASAEEIAKLTYFLCIENSYINGQNIIIDGGLSCK
jgi:3-oxoacyl-[acyl-carrier protein] reductase